MRSVYEQRVADAREIERQIRQGSAKLVGSTKFPVVARVLWMPPNTAAQLAVVASEATSDRVSVRTVERWLADEIDNMPHPMVLATMNEIFRRQS